MSFLTILRKGWPIGLALAVLAGFLFLKTQLDFANARALQAETSAKLHLEQANHWRTASEVQSEEVAKLGVAFTEMKQTMVQRDAKFETLWQKTNTQVSSLQDKAQSLIEAPPASEADQVIEARSNLKETEGYDYAPFDPS